ncbi:GlcG/HbpS family heme-binding protein [Amphritea pacifica]|uniref:Heme-binding protein n=1 Tax=Amphritea pacifica TaxID=2811233 RepID=A0ABS2W7R9_9GAMM|nr:heme-binding protein [Amphritea pacifica]MBN0987781.1 heme-binding protein [Amphritea pacifica]MBN1008058.1 heme-binding protein [Amphritea pacifica]
MVRLDLENSITIIQAAFNKSRELNTSPLTVAILDSAGRLISLQRQDGSSMLRPDIAIGKAWGAVAMGKSSRELGRDALERPAFIASLTTLAQGHLVPVAGGVLVRNSDNEVVGAVGVSGDLSDVDELCAITGIEAAGLIADAGPA